MFDQSHAALIKPLTHLSTKLWHLYCANYSFGTCLVPVFNHPIAPENRSRSGKAQYDVVAQQ
jgi:hypothetical protein